MREARRRVPPAERSRERGEQRPLSLSERANREKTESGIKHKSKKKGKNPTTTHHPVSRIFSHLRRILAFSAASISATFAMPSTRTRAP